MKMPPPGTGDRFFGALTLAWRLIPAAALFSLFFVFDGGLEWLGLFGLVPLVLALTGTGCGCGRSVASTWPSL
jgi:hypothetical protein